MHRSAGAPLLGSGLPVLTGGGSGRLGRVLRYGYLLMLAFVVLATLPLELYLGARVWRRLRRLALTVAPVLVVFVAWDLYAIGRGQWSFDPAQTTGLRLGAVPVEEILFFVVVPVAAILTLEAVRIVRGWRIGDEPAEPR